MELKEIKPIVESKLKCKIIKKIGSGTFGSVYQVTNKKNQSFALKIEDSNNKTNILEDEMNLYKNFKNVKGVPEIYWFGTIQNKNILALELLDSTLDKLFEKCNFQFSLKTVLMIAVQLIERIQIIHAKGIIHRDLKPDNFLIGCDQMSKVIHIIDFGLSKEYKTENHIEYGKSSSFAGSLRYSSIRNHKGIVQSRRDDLESIGYILIYFLKGKLPWQGLKEKDLKKRGIATYHIKRNTSLEDLCKDIPEEFFKYMKYCRLLEFKSEPDYDYLKKLFFSIFVKKNLKYDYIFDWITDTPTAPDRAK